METVTLFYATNNKSKLHNMRYRLRDYPIKVVCPDDLNVHVHVEENGKTAVENALIKARAYQGAVHPPIIAGDSGLRISGLPEEYQPGLYVRRVNGKVLSDDEMIEYYAGLAKRADCDCFINYDTGIALITGQGTFTTVIEDIPLKLSAIPNTNRTHRGNPLDVITQVSDGRFFNDLSDEERSALDAICEEKFTEFIVRHLL